MVTLSIWLYGKPSWDLDIEGKEALEPNLFREHGDYMKEHLYKVADILEKLRNGGWNLSECCGALYTLELELFGLNKKEARKELVKLGIDPGYVALEEYEEELIEE